MSAERIELGVSRVAELENVLGELIDLWERGDITFDGYMDEEDHPGIEDVFDRARQILGREEPEEED